jgi:CRISPR-associated protein Cas2
MRNSYLVSYDISDQKRLRRMFKTMRGFGDHLQYSVFRCDLSPQERVLLMEAITPIINHRDDQVLIVDLGPAGGRAQRCVTVLGRASPPSLRRAVVV